MTRHEPNKGDSPGHSTGRTGGGSHERRNVALIVLDTARSVSVDESTMPTLSALAAEGTAFDNAFSSAPWTLPSHASLFTGMYSSEHGAHGGHTYLNEELRTVAESFSEAGYETVGVSNNTWITEEFGFDRGFESFRRGWQYLQSEVDMGEVIRAKHPRAKVRAAKDRLFQGNPLVNAANIVYSEFVQPQGDDGADRTTNWIEGWLEERLAVADGGRPFFLFCNYLEPHVEYRPPREHAEQFLPDGASYEEAIAIRQAPRAYDVGEYEIDDHEFELLRALYEGELAYVDEQLARLRETLEAAGEWEDTLVVVLGDHGENVGEHGFFGHQYNLYDTLIHVPLVIRGGAFDGGDRREEFVQLLDLPETLLDATGVDDPAFREQSRGHSLHPDAAGGREPRDAAVAEYVTPQPSIEVLEDRFGHVPDRVRKFDRRLRAIRTREYKYVVGDDGFERLHHLPDDPNEETNVADEEPRVVAELRDRLERRFEGLEAAEQTGSVSMRDSTKERLADLGYL